jgi:hypothetical protein
MNTVARTVGGAFGGAVVASILGVAVGRGGLPAAHSDTQAFALCAGVLIVGLVVGTAIPHRTFPLGIDLPDG